MKHGVILAFLALFAAGAAAGELVSLRDGTSYVGRITDVTRTHVIVDVEFPAPETRQIPIEQLADRTLWRIRSSRTDPADEAAWMELARWADERGLLVPALVAYQNAARKPGLVADEARKRIADLESKLSQEIFDRGERYYMQGRPASAKRYFEILVSRYPKTPVALMAGMRLVQIDTLLKHAKAAAKAATKAVESDRTLRKERAEWDADASAIRAHLREAVRARPAAASFSRPVRMSRALERVVGHLEKAWSRVRNVGPPPEGVAANAASELRDEVKKRLVRAYLDTGAAYLIRPSVNQAEEYCTKACDLDPENAAAHGLHEKIIYARITSGWWHGGFLGRGRR